MLRRAKRLLIVVGGAVLEEEYLKVGMPNTICRIAEKTNATLAISPGVFKAFQHHDGVKYAVNVEGIVERLKDESWMGFDGKGRYDFTVFVGGFYPFQSMMLSTLKHFAPKVRTIAIDRYYHPNAEFSFDNLSYEQWREGLEALLKALEA